MTAVDIADVGVALRLGSHEHIALIGGGGKTTLLHAVGRQLSGSVVLTTTTKMSVDQHEGLPVLLRPTDADIEATTRTGPVVVWDETDGTKAIGVLPDRCDRWFSLVDHVVVEADGSRRLPFKAPGHSEPVVPSTTTLLVSVMGADAFGQPISDACHRPELVAELAGTSPEATLTAEHAAAVLLHPEGGRKALPPAARFAVVVNKVSPADRRHVDELTELVADREPRVEVVQIGFDRRTGSDRH